MINKLTIRKLKSCFIKMIKMNILLYFKLNYKDLLGLHL